jgi:hypothetical protein
MAADSKMLLLLLVGEEGSEIKAAIPDTYVVSGARRA